MGVAYALGICGDKLCVFHFCELNQEVGAYLNPPGQF